MELAYILSLINSLLGVLFLIMAYTYIEKLEKIGCACSEHPYRKYVKNFTIFLVAYLLLTMFLPPATLASLMGPTSGFLMMALHAAVTLVGVSFFVITIMYVRWLKTEKCKCSEDVRREVMYIISIIEIIAIFLSVILLILLGVTGGALMLVVTAVKSAHKSEGTVMNYIANPISAARSIPGNLKKLPKTLKKFNLKKG